MKRWMGVALAFAGAAMLTGCIDEDLSECGGNFRIDYTVRLRTNLTTEISTELTTQEEVAMGELLRSQLGGVFTDHASDIDLSFFTGGAVAHEESHTLNASQGSFSVSLPVQQYRHLALANVAQEPLVSTVGRDQLATMSISQQEADIIDSHTAGLFSARLDMDVENRNQQFDVTLYMVNSAVALIIDRNGLQPEEMWGYVSGMATSFAVSDSTYSYDGSPTIRTLPIDQPNLYGLYAACMPSRNPQGSTVHGAPSSRAEGEGDGLWQFKAYVKLNGKVTETTLSVAAPLLAGNLKILKGKLDQDGRVVPTTQGVGASVKLDWKEGGNYDIGM